MHRPGRLHQWLMLALAAVGCSWSLGCARETYHTSHQYLPDPFIGISRQHLDICPEHRENAVANGERKLYRWNALVGDEGRRRLEVCGDIAYESSAGAGSWAVSDAFDSSVNGWLLRASLEAEDDPDWQLAVSCVSRSAEFTAVGEESPFSDGLTSGRSLSVSVHGPLPDEATEALLVFRSPEPQDKAEQPDEAEPTDESEPLEETGQPEEASNSGGLEETEAVASRWKAERISDGSQEIMVIYEQDGTAELAALLGDSTPMQQKQLEVVLRPGDHKIKFNSDANAAGTVASECAHTPDEGVTPDTGA